MLPNLKSYIPLLASHQIIPFDPNKGFYIECNGLTIYKMDHPEYFEKLIDSYFSIIEDIKTNNEKTLKDNSKSSN